MPLPIKNPILEGIFLYPTLKKSFVEVGTFFSKYRFVLLIGLILVVGFSLRAYHFSPWLHFELDQARDARVVDDGLQGDFFDLPLLGPKAAGTFLRLPPTFYYLEYVSALIFGASPAGMATVVLIFSVLSVLVFYWLVRRHFTEWLSLGLTLLFAVSPFFVLYGRFAWNPNLLPFFVLLGLYGLLRSVDEQDSKREHFLVIGTLSFAVATHFHFLAFLALPVIWGIFLVYKRPHFSWKTWLLTILLVLGSYLPVVLNDIKSGGTNSAEFYAAITEKSTKEEAHDVVEKLVKNLSEHTLHALVVTTGFEGGALPTFSLQGYQLRWVCLESCDAKKWYGVAAVLVLAITLLTLGLSVWREKNTQKKDFLVLSTIWLSVTFCLFFPLAYAIAPRFFLLSGPVFFILIGVLISFMMEQFQFKIFSLILCGSVIALLAYSNLSFLAGRFDELDRANTERVESAPDRILKERFRVTLEQQERIVAFFDERFRKSGYPVYMASEPFYQRSLKYLMEQRGIVTDGLSNKRVYRQGEYFLVLRSGEDIRDRASKYADVFQIIEVHPFGTLSAIELEPRSGAVMGERQDFSKPDSVTDSRIPPRYTWREWWGSGAVSGDEDEADEEADLTP